MQTNLVRSQATPARLSLRATSSELIFGKWKLTAYGVSSRDNAVVIEPSRLWEGLGPNDDVHALWEAWAAGKNRHFDAPGFLDAIRAARVRFSHLRPADVPMSEDEDALIFWRSRDVFDDRYPHAEFYDRSIGAAFRAEKNGENRYTLFIVGKQKRTHRIVRLTRRKDGTRRLVPPLPPKWSGSAMLTVMMIGEVAK